MRLLKQRKFLNNLSLITTLSLGVTALSTFIPYFNLDLQLSRVIQSTSSPLLTQLLWVVSLVGNSPAMLIVIGITSLFLYLKNRRTEAVFISLSSAGAAIFGSLMKILIDRPRPTTELVTVRVWLADNSYPSNHVLVFTVFFGFLIYLLLRNSKLRVESAVVSITLMCFIILMGISRVYLGAHWASDVLGGYLLGSLWLIITIRIYNSHNGKR